MSYINRRVMCVKNDGYYSSLIIGKFYCVHDPAELKLGYLRIIDESGEDYLYPTEYFIREDECV